MSAAADALVGIYVGNDDPWRYRTRWYERRKRTVLLASLLREHYGRILECGCSNGELSAALALRADVMIALDNDIQAVALAAERLAGHAGAQVLHMQVPTEWPDQRFDLVVISEMAYYLEEHALDTLMLKMGASLTHRAEVIACHWRHPIDGAPIDAESIHARLHHWANARGMVRGVSHREPDFVMDSWSHEPQSLAALEGLL